MVWSNVAQLYMGTFESARLQGTAPSRKSLITKTLDQRPRELPTLNLNHLSRMTDSTGVFQHAAFSVPNFSEGYCSDDNARALILAVLLGELGEDPETGGNLFHHLRRLLHHAFDPETKRFHNHMSFDRRWLDPHGSEDCSGPNALGETRRRGRPFALPQIADAGRAAFRLGAAFDHRVHLAPAPSLRAHRHS